MKRIRLSMLCLIGALAVGLPAAAQLGPAWVVPAAAHTPGNGSTFWMTDLTLHNPHQYTLPVRIFFLPSDRSNQSSPVMDLDLYPWETFNLWDVLGPDIFDWNGTGAFLIFADTDYIDCDDSDECAFLVTSRTYTPDPGSATGEYGQGIPGALESEGLDWWTYGYAAGILNDGDTFRTNVGVASWTGTWTTVRFDVQDAAGNILATGEIDVPPFGHVQNRLAVPVSGGSLVFYLVDGPDDTLVFPYASVVNQETGDPTYIAVHASPVGTTSTAAVQRKRQRPVRTLSGLPRPQPERTIHRSDLPPPAERVPVPSPGRAE